MVKSDEILKQLGIKELLEACFDGIVLLDDDGKILYINNFAREIVEENGCKLVIGDFFKEIIPCLIANPEISQAAIDQFVNPTSLDYEVKLKSGKWFNVRLKKISLELCLVIAQDIHTKKEIELSLEKSVKKYISIYNKAPVMMHAIDHNYDIISVSDYWLRKMGYERGDVIGKKTSSFISKNSSDIWDKCLAESKKTGVIKDIEIVCKTSKEDFFEVLLSANVQFDGDGYFERLIIGMVDISALKNVERELKKSRQDLMDSQKISRIGNFEYSIDQKIFNVSDEAQALIGLDTKSVPLDRFAKVINPIDRLEFVHKWSNATIDFLGIFRLASPLKSNWVSLRGRLNKEDKNKVYGTVQDITEQKIAEDEIEKLRDRFLMASDIANIGVWEFDRFANKIHWEKEMFNIFPAAKRPIIGMLELEKLVPKSDFPLLKNAFNQVKRGQNLVKIEFGINYGGGPKHIRSFTKAIRTNDGKLKKLIGVIYDITNDKTLQDELKTSLEEKNVLVREVHHRVKNNMQLISSLMALKAIQLTDPFSKSIFEEVNQRIKSMAIIHDKLYTFYNVSEIIISKYLESIKNDIELLFDPSKLTINVASDDAILNIEKALLIGLIVSEIISNISKHSYKGNKINVQVSFRTETKRNELIITNDGLKLPENVLDSKEGLGITLIQTFTKQLKGEISLHEENGFKICF